MQQKRKLILGLLNNKKKQFHYAALNIVALVLVILVINTIYIYKFSKTSDICTVMGDVGFASTSEQLQFLTLGSLAAILLSGGACFIFAIILTHRFYGPMVPVLRHIEELRKGNYSSRIRLRQTDELQDLSEKLNALTEELEKKYQK